MTDATEQNMSANGETSIMQVFNGVNHNFFLAQEGIAKPLAIFTK
jgi:hypothetical protein